MCFIYDVYFIFCKHEIRVKDSCVVSWGGNPCSKVYQSKKVDNVSDMS